MEQQATSPLLEDYQQDSTESANQMGSLDEISEGFERESRRYMRPLEL